MGIELLGQLKKLYDSRQSYCDVRAVSHSCVSSCVSSKLCEFILRHLVPSCLFSYFRNVLDFNSNWSVTKKGNVIIQLKTV